MGSFSFVVEGGSRIKQNIVIGEKVFVCSTRDEGYYEGIYEDYGNINVEGLTNELDVYAVDGYMIENKNVSFYDAVKEVDKVDNKENQRLRCIAINEFFLKDKEGNTKEKFVNLVLCYRLKDRNSVKNYSDSEQGFRKWYRDPSSRGY